MAGRLAHVTFALLIAATIGAFFVAQRLKRAPPLLQSVRYCATTPDGTTCVRRGAAFSPNGDGRRDSLAITFRLKRADDVTVAVVDADGDVVRTLARGREGGAYERLRMRWNGRDDDGDVVADGIYRPRIALRRQGRSVTVPAAIELDTRPPAPAAFVGARDRGPGPLILPDAGTQAGSRRGVRVRFRGASRYGAQVTIWRTDTAAPLRVDAFAIAPGRHSGVWDARPGGGLPPDGTYVAAVTVRDRAGNVGSDPQATPPRAGSRVRGRPGITVRRMAAQAPDGPVVVGENATVFVDSRGRRYRWQVRRLGAPGPRKQGLAGRARLRFKAPGRESGLYLVELSRRGRGGTVRRAVPIAVQAERRHPVLVVLPWITWQGRNRVDDDGDGLPDTLAAGGRALLRRPFAGGGLPPGFTSQEAPLLVALDRMGLRYDITTDAALAAGDGPSLEDRAGVLLAGSTRWLPAAQLRALNRFVRRGGRVLSLGVDSLRRQVTVSRGALARPGGAAVRDALGLRPVTPLRTGEPAALTVFGADSIELFSGSDGLIGPFSRWEELQHAGGPPPLAAAGPQDGVPVIAAHRLGKGLVIHAGLPELPSRLGQDPELRELLRRWWTLLSR